MGPEGPARLPAESTAGGDRRGRVFPAAASAEDPPWILLRTKELVRSCAARCGSLSLSFSFSLFFEALEDHAEGRAPEAVAEDGALGQALLDDLASDLGVGFDDAEEGL